MLTSDVVLCALGDYKISDKQMERLKQMDQSKVKVLRQPGKNTLMKLRDLVF
jgi:hypothetical protein